MRRVLRLKMWGAVAAALLAGTSAAPAQSVGGIGGDAPQVSGAVDAGLAFLAKRQEGGGWGIGRDGGGGKSAAITSLCTMAFMAGGNVPGQGQYGDVVTRGVDYVLGVAEKNRDKPIASLQTMQTTMYEHGISTVMLCEAYGMVDADRQKRIKPAVASAVALILRAQRVPKGQMQGGWRYTPDMASADISVTGWQLMALRGAGNVGAAIPKDALDAGVVYVKRHSSPSGGFGYVANTDLSPARTGTGIVALELLGQHHTKEALDGGSYLLRTPISNNTPFYFYAAYYCSQAANQLGGKYDAEINRTVRTSLLKSQNANGSWTAGMGEAGAGDNYATAMAVLALTVPYRYLPLYQK